MQNRYSADIGDFGKFHLLRFLFSNTSYSLKQIWYLYSDEKHNNDGLYINYFDKTKNNDTVLEEAFKKIIQNNRRSVKALQEANLINCDYFEPFVTKKFESLPYRKDWLTQALNFVQNCDFVFVDPDNGIATKLVKENDSRDIALLSFDAFKKRSKAGKYIFMDEIHAFYEKSSCVVVYHHLNRTMSHNKQIEIVQSKLQKHFYKVLAIKHKPYSPRVYFFIIKKESYSELLYEKLSLFENSFSTHWEFFP